jgi:hypothetical protein
VTTLPLAPFQDAFARALLNDGSVDAAEPAIGRLVSQPGFAVYRNTVLAGCIDALQANYPAVARLVGDEWFRAAAAAYARDLLPAHPTLLDYGSTFADFLATFAPAAELPYLAHVARVDRRWSEAHGAADAPPLDAAAPARLAAGDMARWRLTPHPAARWLWREQIPLHSIWRRSRAGDDYLSDIDWRGEGVLLTRPELEVLDRPLSRGGAAFLDACARGECIDDAVRAAFEADEGADLAELIRQLLLAGAFTALEPLPGEMHR